MALAVTALSACSRVARLRRVVMAAAARRSSSLMACHQGFAEAVSERWTADEAGVVVAVAHKSRAVFVLDVIGVVAVVGAAVAVAERAAVVVVTHGVAHGSSTGRSGWQSGQRRGGSPV